MIKGRKLTQLPCLIRQHYRLEKSFRVCAADRPYRFSQSDRLGQNPIPKQWIEPRFGDNIDIAAKKLFKFEN